MGREAGGGFRMWNMCTPVAVACRCMAKPIQYRKVKSNNNNNKSIRFLALSFLHGPTLTSIHDYWKTIALSTWTFVGKVMSLLLNMLSRLVITFLPRSKCLLISWLQSPFEVILELKKIKSITVSPSICHEMMGPDAMILVF